MSDTSRMEEATPGGAPQRQTLRTSQGEQARGYLESLASAELIREMQHALRHAERLTHKRWRVVIAADRVEISADVGRTEPARLERAPRDLAQVELDEEGIARAAEEAASALASVIKPAKPGDEPRIKLPPPHPGRRKPRD